MWSFWYDKWFCSFKNLSRVLPNLRSNAKVSFDGGGGARDQCGIPACAEEWLQTDSAVTSAVLLGLVFRCQWGKHEGFVKYFFRLRSNGKEKRVIFFNFRQPPNTLHIHSSDRERTWPEAHCHVCDCRAFSTMTSWSSTGTLQRTSWIVKFHRIAFLSVLKITSSSRNLSFIVQL